MNKIREYILESSIGKGLKIAAGAVGALALGASVVSYIKYIKKSRKRMKLIYSDTKASSVFSKIISMSAKIEKIDDKLSDIFEKLDTMIPGDPDYNKKKSYETQIRLLYTQRNKLYSKDKELETVLSNRLKELGGDPEKI